MAQPGGAYFCGGPARSMMSHAPHFGLTYIYDQRLEQADWPRVFGLESPQSSLCSPATSQASRHCVHSGLE